ncbi:MAG: GntP family permease, partial [Bdellovibrionales bacterium]|nr:GntP family permease [Bdellovibrionales bacterium]
MTNIEQVGPYLCTLLVACITLIVFSSVKWRLHPFLSLTFTSLFFGLSVNTIGKVAQIPSPLIPDVVSVFAQGFGALLSSIGLVIIFGTLLGKVLEKSGATELIAHHILQKVGVRHSPWAMSLMGWVVSIPVFCDSGYILLSPLKKSLAKVSGIPLVVLAISLATGLYASHTFVPPTPGPLVAAANLGLSASDILWLIILGAFVSFVAMLSGNVWAQKALPYVLKLNWNSATPSQTKRSMVVKENNSFHFFKVASSLLLPLGLMALASIASFPLSDNSSVQLTLITGTSLQIIKFLGHPFIALMIGFLWALLLLVKDTESNNLWIVEGLKEAAIILMITGAGGGFGAVIKASPLADYIKLLVGQNELSPIMALWFLFFISALLKIAQSRSTASL